MVKAICPNPACHEPVVVTPTGKKKREGWSAEWWRIVSHKINGEFCPGSGQLV